MKVRQTGRTVLTLGLITILTFLTACPKNQYQVRSAEDPAPRYLSADNPAGVKVGEWQVVVWTDPGRRKELGRYPDGTQVKVIGVADTEPQMVKIRLPDGMVGWVEAYRLRKRPNREGLTKQSS